MIDPGSRVWKVGFSGEGRPRDVFVAGPLWSFFATSSGSSGTDVDREDEIAFLEQKLQDCLRGVFFKSAFCCIIHHPIRAHLSAVPCSQTRAREKLLLWRIHCFHQS